MGKYYNISVIEGADEIRVSRFGYNTPEAKHDYLCRELDGILLNIRMIHPTSGWQLVGVGKGLFTVVANLTELSDFIQFDATAKSGGFYEYAYYRVSATKLIKENER